MRQVKLTEAGKLIEEHFLGSEPRPKAPDDDRLAKVRERLDAEHPAVDAVGFDTDFAKTHGIGFSSSGAGKGYVLIPFRDERGTLLGYLGTTEELWLPREFKPAQNITPFPKRA